MDVHGCFDIGVDSRHTRAEQPATLQLASRETRQGDGYRGAVVGGGTSSWLIGGTRHYQTNHTAPQVRPVPGLELRAHTGPLNAIANHQAVMNRMHQQAGSAIFGAGRNGAVW